MISRSSAWFAVGLIPLVVAAVLTFGPSPAHGQANPVRVTASEVTSEFPDGMRFRLDAESDVEIESVAVRFRIGQQTRGIYDYLDIEKSGQGLNSELFWRTNTSARYIPPGTIITYNFEVVDANGEMLETEREQFVYQDARFNWEEVSEGPITVAYHGPVKKRADDILAAMLETFDTMGPLLGADTETPVRVTMYNNVKEMLEALPPGSTTIRRELITEGQAFVDVGTLLVHANSRGALGTASHEMIHILTHRAGDSVLRGVPQWIDEGLSEFGNVEPGFSYDIALEFAMATDRMLPITSMPSLPGNPEDVIIYYGEASSIVRFLVFAFGPEKMTELMATMKAGTNVSDAIQQVYGLTLLELENAWRDVIGAPRITREERERVLPTPVPNRVMLPYSLTPSAHSEAVTSVQANVSENQGTLQPQIVNTPTPAPTSTPAPTVVPDVPAAPPASDAAPEQAEPSAPGCALPRPGAGMIEVSSLGLLVGLVAMGLRRRARR